MKQKNSFFIPGNVPSSKNNKIRTRWGGMMVSKATQDWVKKSKPYFVLYKNSFLQSIEKKSPPYKISFKFIRGTKQQFDYVNPLQTIQDMMTGSFDFKKESIASIASRTWLPDDNADVILPSFEPYEYDKENPGVFITIL